MAEMAAANPHDVIRRARWMALIAALFIAGATTLVLQLCSWRFQKPVLEQAAVFLPIAGIVIPFSGRVWVMLEALALSLLVMSLGVLLFGRRFNPKLGHG